MRMTRLYTLLTLILCATAAIAQSVSLQVRQQVAEGDKFTLTIQIKDIEASAPQPLQLQNCTLIYGPSTSTGMSTTIINGNTSVTSYSNYTYTYRADKASTVNIPAVTVTAKNGKKYSTQATKLTILPAGQRPSAATPPQPGRPQDSGVVDAKGHFSKDDMFVRINVNKTSVYEQQPIVATIKLYTKLNISSFQLLTQPTFEGFLSEELDVSNEPNAFETVNGQEYYTAVLKRCILYPQRTGKLTLSSGTYEVTLQDRVMVNSGSFIPDIRIVEKQVRTPENIATINVMELPSPKPAGFDGAVGTFIATGELSTENLHTNEPVTYTIKVNGTGNIKYLKTPTLNLPPGFDVYTPKTDIDAHYSGGNITGTYTVTYTIVPQEVGKFEIPPIQFSYFNPSDNEYKTITLKGYSVKVAKGLNSAPTEQQSIAKGMTDILHIKTGNHHLHKHVHYVYHSLWYWALYLLLTLALITVIIVYRRQLKLNADVRGRQLARAMRKAMKRFKTARAAMAAHNSEKFYADISLALWGYLSDKLGIPSSQLLRDNIAAELANYGVDQAGTDNIINILDECEMARFTPMHSDADMSGLYDKVVAAVKSIENVKK